MHLSDLRLNSNLLSLVPPAITAIASLESLQICANRISRVDTCVAKVR